MTGRDLIVYILKNHLEDELIFENGTFIGLMNENQMANKFGVGAATIRVWYFQGKIDGYLIGDSIFFPTDTKDPREEDQ